MSVNMGKCNFLRAIKLLNVNVCMQENDHYGVWFLYITCSHMSHDRFYGEEQSQARKTGLHRVIKARWKRALDKW